MLSRTCHINGLIKITTFSVLIFMASKLFSLIYGPVDLSVFGLTLGYDSIRVIIMFWGVILAVSFSAVFSYTMHSRVTSCLIILLIVIESLVFYGLHSIADGWFQRTLIGPFASGLTFFTFKHRTTIFYSVGFKMLRSSLFKSLGRNLITSSCQSNLSLLTTMVYKAYFISALFMSILILTYASVFNIVDGSIYSTIQINQHFDIFSFGTIASDIISAILIIVVVMSYYKENKSHSFI